MVESNFLVLDVLYIAYFNCIKDEGEMSNRTFKLMSNVKAMFHFKG